MKLILLVRFDFFFLPVIFYPDDVADRKKKKKARVVVGETRLIPKLQPKFIFDKTEQVKQITNTLQLDGTNHFKEDSIMDLREVRQKLV